MRDILPEELAVRNRVQDIVQELFKLYGYRQVQTPTIEPYELYAARSGEEIRHRMYTFTDLGGRKVVLRPEATATISRLVVRAFRSESLPIRLGYILPMYRYDEPQRGRYREFLQAGFELFGSKNVEADMEIIQISDNLMKRLGFKEYSFKIGHQGLMKAVLRSGGIDESEQSIILSHIDKGRVEEAEAEIARLSKTDIVEKVRRLILLGKEGNDEEALERGSDIVKGIPEAEKALDEFSELVELCRKRISGKMKVDLGFVRGLEYYTGMVFEVMVKGFPVSVNGGGRYDGLTGLFGYPLPGVGCAPGLDRLVLALKEKAPGYVPIPLCMVAITSPQYIDYALNVAEDLRSSGIPTLLDVNRRDLRSALRYSSGKGIRFVVMIGEKEVKENRVTLKDMKGNIQTQPTLAELPNQIHLRIEAPEKNMA
ncbi:MAG: histidine--tRNA ligase [Thermoproteota archaeon]